jgi:iron complex transport system substrate-binding protein
MLKNGKNCLVIPGSILMMILLIFSPIGHAGDFVTDSLGRRVEIPETVDRIACMYAFCGHVVAIMGRADDIVAVSNGLKRDVLLRTMYPSIKNAVVPKFQGAINVEELAGAKPDIVFVAADTGKNSAETSKLDHCGLTWIAIDFNSMDEQQNAVSIIGAAIGAPQKADEYNAYYRSCIFRVKKAVSPIPEKSRTRLYQATVEPTRTIQKEGLSADWLQTAGVINVSSENPEKWLKGALQVGIEQILLWNPEVIIANEPGVTKFINQSPKWAPINAVKNNRVYQMPIGISRWGHPGSLETPLALFWALATIYPEHGTDVDLKMETRHFYKDFFNYDLTDEMIGHILSGKGMRLTKNRKKQRIK